MNPIHVTVTGRLGDDPRTFTTRDGTGGVELRIALGIYRMGKAILPATDCAWLALCLTWLAVRDDAWARMNPAHHAAHLRLWTDMVRRAQAGYVAAPASLLAVTAWQGGNGALANAALDRALAYVPGYSMALLLRQALGAGAPPSVAAPPMTPEQVAESYASESGEQPEPGTK